jgi:hypothetical protein
MAEPIVPQGTFTAISLWEPWASLMRTGAKTVETRSWYTAHRGPLLICAAKRQDVTSLALLNDPEFQRGLRALRPRDRLPIYPSALSFGLAVALVDLLDCRQTGGAAPPEFASEEAFGDYSAGRFMWCTRNLRTFEPFAVRGSQGLFKVEIPARTPVQEVDRG